MRNRIVALACAALTLTACSTKEPEVVYLAQAEFQINEDTLRQQLINDIGSAEKRAIATPGTVGYQIRTPRPQHFSFGPDELLVLHSDGLQDNFDFTDHPEILSRSAGQLSREIVTRFGKEYDDVSCLVARYAR